MSIKSILGTVAPFLGAMVGGPFGAAAGKLLGEFLLGDENASNADIEKALSSASPETLVKLRKIDSDYKTKMASLGIDEQKIAAMDRDSARKRQVSVKDTIPSVLAVMLTLGFFGILFAMMYYPIQAAAKSVIDIMLGSLGTAWISCITYYFGSSYGSQIKTQLMKDK